MSHYSRLKVTQDAPVEVIRAAYRVLAAKYHPDRQAPGEAGADAANEEMAALNTAYQVLINPQTRKDYDALLAERKALRKSRTEAKAKTQAETESDAGAIAPAVTRVDMEWIPPKHELVEQPWWGTRRMLFLGGSATGVVVFFAVYWIWVMVLQHQMERALSDQYASRPPVTAPVEPAAYADLPGMAAARAAAASMALEHASAASRAPAITDLTKLSNEELAELVSDVNDPVGALRRRTTQHPLDGQPLNLRQDGRLIEVLPEARH